MTKYIAAAIVAMLTCGLAFAALEEASAKGWLEGAFGMQSPQQTERLPAIAQKGEQSKKGDKLGFFDFSDSSHAIKARVYLPDSLGKWAVENPWRKANESLIKAPQVFVKVNFQSMLHPQFYGLLRVSYDLDGYDCGVIFSKLGELNNLQIKRYTVTDVKGIDGGKLYVFEFRNKQDDRLIVSKVLCDAKTAIELLIVSPNDQQYSNAINSIVQNVEMSIPATPEK
jgi:hypothetical protein